MEVVPTQIQLNLREELCMDNGRSEEMAAEFIDGHL